MAKWDWYQTTVFDSDPQESGLVDLLLRAFPLSDYAPRNPVNGYAFGGAIRRGSETLCELFWGGNPGVNLKATSDRAPALAEALQLACIAHFPTRVDACEDWDSPGLFDKLSSLLIAYAQAKRLVINQQGDWVRGQGRALYLGSKSSPVRLVLYEKGHEMGGNASLDWVRLEVRVRPKRSHRAIVAGWVPGQAFGAGWVPSALESIGWDHLDRYKVGTVWRQSDTERAFRHMVKQYKAIFLAKADEAGGFDKLGEVIRSAIAETV